MVVKKDYEKDNIYLRRTTINKHVFTPEIGENIIYLLKMDIITLMLWFLDLQLK